MAYHELEPGDEEFLEEYIHISLKISMHDYDYFNQYNKGYC